MKTIAIGLLSLLAAYPALAAGPEPARSPQTEKTAPAQPAKAEKKEPIRKAKAKKGKSAPRITKEQATKTALLRAKGAVVKEAELEREKGRLVWSFDLEDAGKIREIQVSAWSGKIVSDTIESPTAEKAEARADKAKSK